MITPIKIGYYVSGAGHFALIFWALFGGLFKSEPMPFEVTDVTTISEAEYQALFAPSEAPPDLGADIAMPEAPAPEDSLPDIASPPDTPPALSEPEVAEPAEPDPVPTAPVPPPDPQVTDVAPEMRPPSEDVAVLIPETSVRPQPRPAPRVAPEPVAQPEPDVRIDDRVQEAVTAEPDAEIVQDEQEATSPEESTTEIVTEADSPEQAAPSRSVRPQTRPQRAVAEQEPQPEPRPQPSAEPEPDTAGIPSESAVEAALAEAMGLGAAEPAPAPTSAPMTGAEREALRVAVQSCWNVDVGSAASRVTVTVGVELDRQGRVTGEVRRISAEGGDGRAQDTAFQAARRAVLRCQRDGYDLPVEKYDRWRSLELVFNPEGMRLR
jgi:hypothetical protein